MIVYQVFALNKDQITSIFVVTTVGTVDVLL